MFITINYSIILIACVLIRWHWIRSFHSAFPGTTYKRPRSLDDWRAKRMSAEESIPVNEETEGLPRSGEIHRIHPHYPPFMERQTNAPSAVRIRFLSCSRLDVGVRYFRWQRRWQSDVNGFFTDSQQWRRQKSKNSGASQLCHFGRCCIEFCSIFVQF